MGSPAQDKRLEDKEYLMQVHKGASLRNLAMLFSLYMTQFLGFSFILEALIVILRKSGMPLGKISFIYLLGLFWGIKFLWAPVLDRIRVFRGTGHFKGWILISQSLLVATLLCISLFDVVEDTLIIGLLGVAVSFFSSTQDVAVDALAYKVLSPEERGIGNGIKISGGLTGYLLGGGLSLVIYGLAGWVMCVMFLSVITFISLIQVIFFREEELPASKEKTAYGAFFVKFWKGRNKKVWLIFLVVYPIGVSMSYMLMSPVLVDAGWSPEQIGFVVNVLGSSAGAAAAFAAGWIVGKAGRQRTLVVMAFLQIFCVLFLLLPVYGYSGLLSAGLAVGAIMLLYSPSATIMSTLMMDMCSDETPATDFAMQHSLNFMVGMLCGAFSTWLAGIFGYAYVIMGASVASGAALLMSLFLYRFLNVGERAESPSAAQPAGACGSEV